MNGQCLHYECTNRNSLGYCQTTACVNCEYSKECIGVTTTCSPNAVFKPVTNADRIRAMTDEELAEWFLSSGLPPGATKLVCHWDNRSQMKEEWLGWLKEERGG